MTSLVNINILALGVVIAASLILGFVVFANNRRSVTNQFFLFFIIVNSIWAVVAYFTSRTVVYQSLNSADGQLWVSRVTICLATFQAYSFAMLMYVFPHEEQKIPPLIKWGFSSLAVVVAAVTLSPYAFKDAVLTATGYTAAPGPGIAVFGTFATAAVIAGIVILIRKIIKAPTPVEKTQLKYLLWGLVVMFIGIISCIFIPGVVFGNTSLIPLAGIFTLPFIVSTTYAIFKHHLLSVKVVTTEILTFVLCVISLADVVFSTSLFLIVFRIAIFLFVLIFGIFLIQSVVKEIQQREKSEELAKEVADKNLKLNEKTIELDKELAEIEKMNKYMVDRELKMVELKKEIDELKSKLLESK